MISVLQGNCLSVLATLPAQSIQSVCTSPPYYHLRDYNTAQWHGGDPVCDHQRDVSRSLASSGLDRPAASNVGHRYEFYGTCAKCGAVRIDQQLGQEATPDEYVANLVAIFREVRRVLRNDGTVWLNLGDSRSGKNSVQPHTKGRTPTISGLASKQLLMIPARVALALQADGWLLRSDIIWLKPSVMPESVKDRPTSCYEHVFLLAKSARYFYDQAAVREPALAASAKRYGYSFPGDPDGINRTPSIRNREKLRADGTRNSRNVWRDSSYHTKIDNSGLTPEQKANAHRDLDIVLAEVASGATEDFRMRIAGVHASFNPDCPQSGGRQQRMAQQGYCISRFTSGSDRNLWTINPRPYGKHYATMPPALAERCIKAGSRPGDTILDPFGGAGTTAVAAQDLGRDCILIELNADYCELARQRLGLFESDFIQIECAEVV
jgi:DNA modification methylase